MKRIILSTVFVFMVIVTYGQEDIYKTIAAETCDCVTKRGIDISKRSEVEMALGLCMLQSIEAHDIQIDASDDDAMSKFGEKIGLQMAPLCPNIFGVFLEDEMEKEDAVIELTGTVKSIEKGEFLFVIFKETSGKEHKLLWLHYFSGSDDFKDDPKKLVGKKATISYVEFECYFPKLNGYYNAKEITNLKVGN